MSDGPGGVRTFLIADVRGYSRFTEEYGDDCAKQIERATQRIRNDPRLSWRGHKLNLR